MNGKSKPVYEAKLRQIRASVFRNKGKDGRPYFNTQLVRRYKSGESEWSNSSHFTGKEDLVLARQLIDDVLEFLYGGGMSTEDVLEERSVMTGLRSDAFTELTPLRELLAEKITDAEVEKIAAEHRKGRRLYLGTVNVDTLRSNLLEESHVDFA